jgi:hypothetical protein
MMDWAFNTPVGAPFFPHPTEGPSPPELPAAPELPLPEPELPPVSDVSPPDPPAAASRAAGAEPFLFPQAITSNEATTISTRRVCMLASLMAPDQWKRRRILVQIVSPVSRPFCADMVTSMRIVVLDS